ncbi:class I SAM-dependent methyltransferase [Blastococcus sp. TF02A-26]|uniref:class I SAM-dependent methyltransferase n=1 Tax=Blastococcus sp. TF02A-26 TaxID=2250577 RepID=UPI000DEBBB6F|nr:class I SAM-dependent methyltransferase [Blastococcus sp. TF02A-26]RBY89850.1 class I SAM-dependent methyltransferase [Blastococcus sp. TF02A-26]
MRRLREELRGKVGRVLEDYVVSELRSRAEAQDRAQERLTAEVVALREELGLVERRLESSMRAWERRQRRDLLTVTDGEAARTSAAFLQREMERATPYFDKADTLAAGLKAADVEGLFLEFGVYSGTTLQQIVGAAPPGSVFGFDSFQGLPEDWRTAFVAGTFAMTELPEVPGAELVVGWFDETLPGFLAEHPEPAAFVHLDADLYSSTKIVLDALESRLRPGTVLVFDEYFNFPDWEAHEHRAWTEFVERTGITFEYLGFTADDEQIALRLTGVPGAAS